jgi:signal transduction histidine kinase
MAFQRHQSAFVLASLVTVASFVGATAYTQRRLMRMDELSSTIETNAAPSAEYLGRGGMRLSRLRQLLDDAVASPAGRTAEVTSARVELQAFEKDTASYFQLSPLSGENALWDDLRRAVQRAIDLADAVLDAEENGDNATARLLLRTQGYLLERADDSILAVLEFDVRASERLAREVRGVRRTTAAEIAQLDAFATGVAAVAAFIAYRASRNHDRLMRSHNQLLSARIDELDHFAGRVAHDILSPLGVVGFGLALVEPSADAKAKIHITRMQKALQRVQELVDGLLAFARSGAAEPGRDARCLVESVLTNVAADVAEAAAAAGTEVDVQPSDHLEAACRVGVLTSIVQNLARNAIKYMNGVPVRRVILRARPVGDMVRVEVQDTGPGIPYDLQDRLFEPFIRGRHEDISGIGLGLATVKRLAEGHGGSAGVQSRPGAGALFWVQLPRATSPTTPKG